jgi:hypothetical protein
MAKRLGSKLDRGFGLGSLTKLPPVRAHGIYPRKGEGLGEYGTINFPTVLEAYNRESDYKRWRLGQSYYYGYGRSWDDVYIYSNSRFPSPAVTGVSKDIVAMFPSESSPERTWYVGMRTRGSIILPSAIQSSDITLNTSSADPANHTLTYDVNGILTSSQLQIWSVFIGDQFEDTATGTTYPDDLVKKPVGSVALTLIAVNVSSMTLVFDLSKPQGRIEKNGRIYWKALPYDPAAPTYWSTTNGRHLCSAFKLFCCCPDHLGGALANLEFPKESAGMDAFPLPNASRTVNAPWEKQGAGYYRQWRTLPNRIDQRRECKHIHAMRWECGIPWYEPNDYPVTDANDAVIFSDSLEREFDNNVYREYHARHRINYDRYALSLAEVVGLTLFPGSDVRDNIRSDGRPMLWNDAIEPLASWCRQNDWWCKRGTQEIKIFNSTTNEFEDTVNVGGTEYPFIEVVEEGSATAPVIVP